MLSGSLIALLVCGGVTAFSLEKRRARRREAGRRKQDRAERTVQPAGESAAQPEDDAPWLDTIPHMSSREDEIDRRLKTSGTAVVLSSCGALVSPVFTLAALPFLGASLFPMARSAASGLKQGDRVALSLLDLGGVLVVVVTGKVLLIAMSTTGFHLSRKLLARTEDQSVKGTVDIFAQRPQTVWRLQEGVEVETRLGDLGQGDVIAVHPGQVVPVDGVIVEGFSRIDERLLTGESKPAEKGPGDPIFATTTVLEGRIAARVERSGQDTIAEQINTVLRTTNDFKSSVVARGEQVVARGAEPTVGLSLLTLPLLGPSSAIAVMWAGFGYHMRIGAPLSILSYLGQANRRGVLIKDGRSLELLSTVDAVVFDKTGTLTESSFAVHRILCAPGGSEDSVLQAAATAEVGQSHPVAVAITEEAISRGLAIGTTRDVVYTVGLGLRTGDDTLVGSGRLMQSEGVTVPSEIAVALEGAASRGTTDIFVAIDGALAGVIQLEPKIRPEAPALIAELKRRGIELYIISGDQKGPTEHLAATLGISNVHAEVLPQDKADLIGQLREQGRAVCFIGDGINDAVALKEAHVSISMMGASAVAVDTASVILMDGNLARVGDLFDLAEGLRKNLDRAEIMTIVPGLFVVGGVYFFNMQVAGAVLWYCFTLGLTIVNGVAPMLTETVETKRTSRSTDRATAIGSPPRAGG